MRTLIALAILIFLASCGNPIKDENANVEVETGTDHTVPSTPTAPAAPPETTSQTKDDEEEEILGFWVGDFEKDDEDLGKDVYVDEGFYWNRNNKINISIDEIRGDSVFGHSVVAGNDRPFAGTRTLVYEKYRYIVREPGDDRYDGEFNFTLEDGTLAGTWVAYKDIDIKHRVYALDKRDFKYDPEVNLSEMHRFIDWTNSKETREEYEVDGEMEEWIDREFASATQAIYSVNASTQRLTKEQVENMKKGDLTIIRNTIYARHGYSFKNRPLRVFFDAQKWYIPVHTDIRADFTDLEKENIQLLLKYEENAAEYYDYFGRG